MINFLKLKPMFFLISFILIASSVFSIVYNRFIFGIDFTGGAIWEISTVVNKQNLEKIVQENNLKLGDITPTTSGFLIKTGPVDKDQKLKLDTSLQILDKNFKEVRFETQGPALGKELIIKTISGAILASLAILFFIARSFKDWRFGLSAVLAMFHDVIILLGAFSLFGKLFGAQVDALFVTALLTTLSASVHDTVVTFDRIRELHKLKPNETWPNLANQALSQTIVRSINNSMTIIIMLTSLVALGSETTRWFGAALLVGATSGTYSSFAIAVPLVVALKTKK